MRQAPLENQELNNYKINITLIYLTLEWIFWDYILNEIQELIETLLAW